FYTRTYSFGKAFTRISWCGASQPEEQLPQAELELDIEGNVDGMAFARARSEAPGHCCLDGVAVETVSRRCKELYSTHMTVLRDDQIQANEAVRMILPSLRRVVRFGLIDGLGIFHCLARFELHCVLGNSENVGIQLLFGADFDVVDFDG